MAMVDSGRCSICKVVFKSKTVRFELKDAKCLYCSGPLRRVGKIDFPVRYVDPPLVNIKGGPKTFSLRRAEQIFGPIRHDKPNRRR